MSNDTSDRRYLSLWLPFLSADRWHHERGTHAALNRPLVFIEKVHGSLRIAASDVRAHALGLQLGLALADARARCTSLHVVPFDPASDRRFLLDLARQATAFTPTVGLDEPNGLALDITGCTHLYGSEVRLAAQFQRTLHSLGATACRIAVASTPDMARALSRFAQKTPCFADGRSMVRALPVIALESRAADIIFLRRAGLKTIGDVASRPSVLFTTRFSPTFTTQLARILGEEDRRISPVRLPPVYAAEHRCVEPIVSLGMVETVLAELAAKISDQLRMRDEGGRLFESVFVRTDGVTRRLRIETSGPTRDPATLMRLHRNRMEALADPLDCGFGFDLIRIEALRTEPFAATQITLDARQEQKEQVGQLVDRLGAMFGRERVIRLRSRDTHIPERAQIAMPAANDAVPASALSSEISSQNSVRPFLLFKEPKPIEIKSSDKDGDEPCSFRWRRLDHKITCIDGPERIADEWWHTPSGFGTRDYYRVESAEGRRFWIFRAEATAPASRPRWFLHGLFP